MAVWAEVMVLCLAAYGLGLVIGWLLSAAPIRLPRRARLQKDD
ncbi:hypothetical protein [Altererythrobacter lutimaris]|nr:hypothetical protein [Altererythrobacter lutimaris]